MSTISQFTGLPFSGVPIQLTDSSAVSIDCSLGSYFSLDLTQSSTISITNSLQDRLFVLNLLLTISDIDVVVTWPANVIWPYEELPNTSDGEAFLISFLTVDGTTWITNLYYTLPFQQL